jgi:hypothetical protein
LHLRDPQLQDLCWQEVTRKKHSHTGGCVCWHVGSPVLGGNPLYRVSKWRTFVGKVPLQILSFRAKLRCVPRKILFAQVAAHV